MTGPGRRRGTSEIIRDRRRIADLYLQGWTQAAIAEDVGRGVGTINRDLKAIQAQWIESALIDFDDAKAQELAKIDRLEREYWDAWERSKQNKESTTKEQTKGEGVLGDGKVKAQKRSEGQVGNPSFLSGVQWCIERRCKIIGIDAPVRQDIKLTTVKGYTVKEASPDAWSDNEPG